MLAARIIPCLDVKDGRVVKGVNFVGLRDAGDPAELAALYDAQGADEICFLDISASVEGRGALLDAVRRTAEHCFTPLTVGGGVRTPDDVKALLHAGADKASINTAAVVTPEVIDAASAAFGAQAIVVAIDAKQTGPDAWEVFTHGGRNRTGKDAIAFAREAADRGAGELLVTSMDRDGVKTGYDLALLQRITDVVRVPVIASGGAGSLQHLVDAITIGHASAALAASIFHFGTHTIAEARAALAAAGVPVRTGMTDTTLGATIDALAITIASRKGGDPTTSYTASLLQAGPQKCAKKLGEEGVEAALAAVSGDKAALAAEAADVLFHLLVTLQVCGVTPDEVAAALAVRKGVSGHDEKKSRL